MIYAVNCARIGTTLCRSAKINDAFNKSAKVSDWIQASDTLWLVNSQTAASDVTDLVRNATGNAVEVFVASLNDDFSSALVKGKQVGEWIERNKTATPQP